MYEPRALMFAGIVNRARGGSWPRRLAWFGLILAGGGLSQIWMLLAMYMSWYVPAVLMVVIVGGFIAMVVTSPRERSGAERFCITGSGIARLALKPGAGGALDSQIVPWGEADAVHLEMISPVWWRLRVGRWLGGGRMGDITFDAGIRCSAEFAPILRGEIQERLASRRRGSLEGRVESANTSPGVP